MSVLYKIKLQNFEGPLDLLLFFVRKDELNIYDIPIARITKSYLEYLQLMQELNLDIASEFILMAATLMRIKVKMMLPKDPVDEEEEEMMDPREELSRRLIEYRQFKEASKSLSELDEYWRQVYRRSYFNFDLLPRNEEEVIGLKDISFFDLLAAYKKALEKKPIPVFHNIERLNVTVEDQQKYIMAFFRERNCYLFTELCDDMSKIEIVVTFLALLDLVKKADIAIKQASIFDDIWIYKAIEFKEEEIPESERAEDSILELTNPLETETANPEAQASEDTDLVEGSVLNGSAETSPEVEIEFKADASQSFEVQQDHSVEQNDADIESPESAGSEIGIIESEVSQSSEFIPADYEAKANNKVEDNERSVNISPSALYSDETEIDESVTGYHANVPTDETEKITVASMIDTEPSSQSDPEERGHHDIVAHDLLNEKSEGELHPVVADKSQHKENENQNELAVKTMSVGGTDEDQRGGVTEDKQAKEIVNADVKIILSDTSQVDDVSPITEIVKNNTADVAVESAKADKTTGTEEKIPRWKNFLNKLVTMVRRIFSK